MSRLGMNTELATDVAGTVSGLASGLALVEQEVRLARAISMNPLNYMLNPGAGILAPTSIVLAASVSVDIANVRQTLDYLVEKLRQEAFQQDQVSNSLTPADPGWLAPGPTARRPADLTLLDEFAPFLDVAGWVLFLESIPSTTGDVFELIQKWWTDMPAWGRNLITYSTKIGKWVPFVGAPVAWLNVAAEWDPDNGWGNTRNFIGAGFATAELLLLIPPATPVGVAVGVGGLLWDAVDIVWDWVEDPPF